MMEKTDRQKVAIGLVLAIIALLVLLISRKKVSSTSIGILYRTKIDAAAYVAMKTENLSWKMDFSYDPYIFKAGTTIGYSVGSITSLKADNTEGATYIIFERSLYGYPFFIGIKETHLSLIQ